MRTLFELGDTTIVLEHVTTISWYAPVKTTFNHPACLVIHFVGGQDARFVNVDRAIYKQLQSLLSPLLPLHTGGGSL